jgi:hypothetical protein
MPTDITSDELAVVTELLKNDTVCWFIPYLNPNIYSPVEKLFHAWFRFFDTYQTVCAPLVDHLRHVIFLENIPFSEFNPAFKPFSRNNDTQLALTIFKKSPDLLHFFYDHLRGKEELLEKIKKHFERFHEFTFRHVDLDSQLLQLHKKQKTLEKENGDVFSAEVTTTCEMMQKIKSSLIYYIEPDDEKRYLRCWLKKTGTEYQPLIEQFSEELKKLLESENALFDYILVLQSLELNESRQTKIFLTLYPRICDFFSNVFKLNNPTIFMMNASYEFARENLKAAVMKDKSQINSFRHSDKEAVFESTINPEEQKKILTEANARVALFAKTHPAIVKQRDEEKTQPLKFTANLKNG